VKSLDNSVPEFPDQQDAVEDSRERFAPMPPSGREVERLTLAVRSQRELVRERARERRKPPEALTSKCLEIDLETLRSGVYLLLRGDDIVYVGSSVGVAGRASQHVRDPRKQFDRVIFLPVDEDKLLDVEGALIRYFHPEHNGNAPVYRGFDAEILRAIGLPAMDPELRRLLRMRAKLDAMREKRRRWANTPLYERLKVYGRYDEPKRRKRRPPP